MAISPEGHFYLFNGPERCSPCVHIACVQSEIWIADFQLYICCLRYFSHWTILWVHISYSRLYYVCSTRRAAYVIDQIIWFQNRGSSRPQTKRKILEDLCIQEQQPKWAWRQSQWVKILEELSKTFLCAKWEWRNLCGISKGTECSHFLLCRSRWDYKLFCDTKHI